MEKIKYWTNDIEQEAQNQLEKLSTLPFIHNHIAVMPDVHAGKGSTIGTVIATKGAVIPSAVGVDIGCGMIACKLPIKIDFLYEKRSLLRSKIESAVPTGFECNKTITNVLLNKFVNLGPLTCFDNSSKELQRSSGQLGTLGGGNHFIEICGDENNDAWVMLHSGSRNIGKVIADYHINGAKKIMRNYFIDLPDPDLAYLVQHTVEFNNYILDMDWALRYAFLNRQEMMDRIILIISKLLNLELYSNLTINCHHNYTALENHFGKNVYVTRKGALSARAGELGVIPGSMGAKSYIVKGLGNRLSFCSCSHGAGRKMSRNKARATFSNEDLENQTQGIECRKDIDIIDEIPSAYKDIDIVMGNQKDLVEITKGQIEIWENANPTKHIIADTELIVIDKLNLKAMLDSTSS
jgi:tRNA-splicing ligase RtcB